MSAGDAREGIIRGKAARAAWAENLPDYPCPGKSP